MRSPLACLLCAVLAACSGSEAGPDSGPMPGPDAGRDGGPAAGLDASALPGADVGLPAGLDAATPGADAGAAGLDAARSSGLDAAHVLTYDAGPSSGTGCTFNSDCPANERCDEDTNFTCTAYPRGTGKTGVDRCNNSNDCETALCVEGWPANAYYCSGPCGTDGGCAGVLPRCVNIAFLGLVCARSPDGGM